MWMGMSMGMVSRVESGEFVGGGSHLAFDKFRL